MNITFRHLVILLGLYLYFKNKAKDLDYHNQPTSRSYGYMFSMTWTKAFADVVLQHDRTLLGEV